jgi:hypothetical protein
MQQTDVKSTRLSSSGLVFAGRARIKGIAICANAGTTGVLVLRDGGSGGAVAIELDIPANSNPNSFYLLIPSEGVLCATNIYASITGLASVTVFYG